VNVNRLYWFQKIISSLFVVFSWPGTCNALLDVTGTCCLSTGKTWKHTIISAVAVNNGAPKDANPAVVAVRCYLSLLKSILQGG
jgi:hypothetical protein